MIDHRLHDFAECIRGHAERRPSKRAFVFLGDGGSEEITLTYAQLDARARSIAASLQRIAQPGDRALLVYPSGLGFIEAFCGCLYAGVIAVPAYPARNATHAARLAGIVEDAAPSVVMTLSGWKEHIATALSLRPVAHWVTTDTSMALDAPAAWQQPEPASDRIAFLQYTSGSTGTPKGVIVSHGNLLDNQRLITRAFGQGSDAVVVGWLPLYHDMGLIGNVLHALWLGGQGVLMAPLRFLRDPLQWLRAVSRYQGTISGGPNFAYEWCVARIPEGRLDALDLSSWQVAFNGAEPVRSATLTRFARTFARCGFDESAFKPCYGLAESTLMVSAVGWNERMHQPRAVAVNPHHHEDVAPAADGTVLRVDCGAPMCPVAIVDQTGRPLPEGSEGEIWVGGASVCGGYWNRPALSEDTFGARLADTGDGPFLRTGDLGLVADGRLYVTGRLKDLIIIRGRNYHPQDIEEVVARSHPGFRPGAGAAFCVSDAAGERLVVVNEVERGTRDQTEALVRLARQAVAEHLELRLHALVLLKPNTIPRTTSGKVRRFECRARFLDGTLPAIFNWQAGDTGGAGDAEADMPELALSAHEAMVAAVFAEVLRVSPIGRSDSFFGLGGDSVAAVDVVARLGERHGLVLTPAELYDEPTVAGLAERLRACAAEARPAAPLAVDTDAAAAALTHVQEGIWLDIQRGVPETAYHIPLRLVLEPPVDGAALQAAWLALVERHDILRSSFVADDGHPRRRVDASAGLDWQEIRLSPSTPAHELERQLLLIGRSAAERSFDLERGPLWRVRLVWLPSGAAWLLVVVHHLIADGVSLHRLYGAWMDAYAACRAGDSAPALPAGPAYAIAAARERAVQSTPAYERARTYWLETLGGTRTRFALPRDAAGARGAAMPGASRVLVIEEPATRGLEGLAARAGTSLFGVLLAGFAVVLHRLTERREVLVAVPLAGRDDPRLADVIGPCVRTAVLRVDVSASDRFVDVVAQVHRALSGAARHGEFPLHALVRELQVPVEAGEFPFTTVAFNGLSFLDRSEEALADAFQHDLGLGSRFDWNCYLFRARGALRLRLVYRAPLFADQTIAYVLAQLRALLDDAVQRPETAIARLAGFRAPALPPRPAGESPRASLAARFAAVAGQLGDRVAVHTPEVTLYYADLYRMAAGIAGAVAGTRAGIRIDAGAAGDPAPAGVLAGDPAFVGVLADDPVHGIQGLLGVLMLGHAYLPLDPRLPDARLTTMIADAGAGVLVTSQSCRARAASLAQALDVPLEIVELETAAYGPPLTRVADINPDSPAYVLYTSGTTGQPKGVLQTQRNVEHFIDAYTSAFGITAEDRLSLFASFAYDAAVVDIFAALLNGASLYPLRTRAGDPLRETPAWLATQGITVFHCTPSFHRALLSHAPGPVQAPSLRWVVLGGEPVQIDDVRRHRDALPAVPLVNLYGQSESSFNSYWIADLQHPSGRVVLGQPIEGVALRVLAEDGSEAGVYATGIIVVDCEHVSPGYWKRPGETARAFGTGIHAARCYTTGDMGRRLPDGSIEFLGRRDGMVKLRGHRIERGEIQEQLRAHPEVRDAAVVVTPEREQLCAYLVAAPGLAVHEVETWLRRYLPEHMVPASWTVVSSLPLTPNGKLDVAALPRPDERPQAPAVPQSAIETRIQAVFADTLGRETVGLHDSFFALGGDSLTAMRVLARLNRELGWRLTLANFVEGPTVAALVQAGGAGQDPGARTESLGAGDQPLSHAQHELWTISQLEGASGAYNLFGAYEWMGPVDARRLEAALQQVIEQHPALRTAFHQQGDQPRQRVHARARLALARVDLSPARAGDGAANPAGDPPGAADPLARARAMAVQESAAAVDLAAPPLLWAALCRLGADHHVLMLRLPHIVADGWSMVVLVRDLLAHYVGTDRAPTAPAARYLEHVAQQRAWLEGPEAASDLAYWQGKLDRVAPLMLPTAHPRPSVKRFQGATVRDALGPAWATRLRSLAAREGVSDFVALVALVKALLYRYTGQPDIAVGTALAGRDQADRHDQVGLYAGLLVLRDHVDGGRGFRALLREVSATVAAAIRHGRYPFDLLAKTLGGSRDPSRHPLFDVSITLDEESGSMLAEAARTLGPAVHIRPLRFVRPASKFDLSFAFVRQGDDIELALEYDSQLFEEAWIRRVFGHLRHLLDSVVTKPERPVERVEILTPAERAQLLGAWNDTRTESSLDRPLHRMVEQAAARAPGALAVVDGARRVTYEALNRAANQLARHLRARGVQVAAPVVLCLDRSLDFVVAALAVLKAGGAYLPFDPAHPRERLAHVLADTGAGVVIAHRDDWQRYGLARSAAVCLETDRDDIARHLDTDLPGESSARDLAYIIYTSGSTGMPKGVMVEHRSVANLIAWHCRNFAITAESRGWLLASVGFDAGVWELWPYLAAGASVHVVPAEHQTDLDWLAACARDSALTHVFLPTRLYEHLAAQGPVLPEGITVLTGGDRLRRQDAHGWQVWNNYGPTECTVVATSMYLGPGPGEAAEAAEAPERPIPIGRPIDNTRVYILDAAQQPVPAGVPGELYIAGEGLARGYWQQPALTAERFVAVDGLQPQAQRLYRTGDLGRFRDDGTIEFLGRLDHQVQVQGVRVEPAEVEAALARHHAVQEAVVLGREDERGAVRLVGYVVPRPGATIDPHQLRAELTASLPRAMWPSALVPVERLPLNASGKVDRDRLPAVDLAHTPRRPGVAPRDRFERVVVEACRALLDAPRVDVMDNFFELGGDSITATRLVAMVREQLGTPLSVRDVFDAPTLAQLAARLARRAGAGDPGDARDQAAAPDVLSFAQERLWFLAQLDPTSPTYNVHGTVRLRGPLAMDALERALARVVARHQPLRMVFPEVGGKPMPRLLDWTPAIPLAEVQEEQLPARIHEAAAHPFDVAQGPLLRVQLLRVDPGDHVLLVTMHHLVSDGWSIGVLIREWIALYMDPQPEGEGAALPALPLDYAAYARQQRSRLQGPRLDAELAYWREYLAGLPPLLALPTDRPRPAVQSYRGARSTWTLPAALQDALQDLGRLHGTTLFTTLAAALSVLLARYSGQRDIAIGYPVAGRTEPALHGLIGLFVNTLVLRSRVDDDQRFADLLAEVREHVLAGQEHQELPFERVVEALQPARSLSYAPLFQVMLVLQPTPMDGWDAGDLRIEPMPQHSVAAKVDLTLEVEKTAQGLRMAWIYSTALFDGDTIARMAGHLQVLLEAVARAPELRVGTLPLLTAPERQQLLVAWNHTARPYPEDRCIHELFAAQAARTPDAIAVVCGHDHYSFAGLARRVRRLSRHLRALGVGPESRVGMCMDRGVDLIVGLLAILDAGGAYVPLDPAYPEARIAHILSDARPRLLLTQTALRGRCEAAGVPALCLDTDWARVPAPRPGPGPAAVAGAPDRLAYIIYTSGSTGMPRGVAITHRNAVALLAWAADSFDADERAGVLATTSICFDLSVFELFLPLVAGGTVVLAEDALALPELPARERVSLVNTVPSAMEALLRGPGLPASVRTVNLAGEPLSRELADGVYRCGQVQRLMNLYGPSEDTTYSTAAWVPATSADKPLIGRPIANGTAYVLDGAMQPVPVGIPGELYLGGAGVARGYHGRPRVTGERFVPDPFGSAPGGRLYRTGDLVRCQGDGALEFLSRIDHQVKLRGFRIEPGEIEATLLGYPEVRQAVVVVRATRPGDERLVGYVVPEAGAHIDATALRTALSQVLPAYMVPAALVVLDALPLTPNGKLDRAALPAIDGQAPAREHTAPRTATELRVAAVWAEVLDRSPIGIYDDFFALGGHSLLATQVVARIREQMGVALPLKALFERTTVAELAELVDPIGQLGQDAARRSAARHGLPPLAPAAGDGPHPLSFAQQRLWILHRLFPDSPMYNMPAAVRLQGRLDVAALRDSLAQLARRHEVLRAAVVVAADGVPAMRVAADWTPAAWVAAAVEVREAELPAQVRAITQAPFDLEHGPLLRVALLRLADEDHVLVLAVHHIVSDGWSMGILVREWMQLYEARVTGVLAALPALPVRYADYARWQAQWAGAEVIEAELRYWRERLAGLPPLLELPTDRPRPAVQSADGASLAFHLPASLTEALGALSRAREATLFMTLGAALAVLLSRHASQHDIAIGYPIAGRTHPALEGVVGLFVNTLVLRCDLASERSFLALLDEVRTHTLDGYEHQNVPFERVVDALQPARSMSHAPLFQVMLSLQNTPARTMRLPGLAITGLPQESAVAKVDLTLDLEETPDGLRGAWVYSTALFDRATIERLAGHFRVLLEAIVARPQTRVSALPLLTEAERRQILIAWNDTAADHPRGRLAHHLIEEQVQRTPDAIALVQDDQQWSYRYLDRRANRVAWRLAALGQGPESLVGICVERSPEMVAAVLGVLKAGAAWVPIDPGCPPARLRDIVTRAGISVMLTQRRLAARVVPESVTALCLDDAAMQQTRPYPPEVPGTPEMTAYVIFTSGTTGQPKGVVVPHASLVAHLPGMLARYEYRASDRVLQFAPFDFDVAVQDIMGTLRCGATLVLPPHGLDAVGDVAGRIDADSLTVLNLSPALWRLLLREWQAGRLVPHAPAVRLVVTGSDVADPALSRSLRNTPAGAVLVLNAYGPTEATVTTSTYDIGALAEDDAITPVGRPMQNRRTYVLDPAGEPVPVGVYGELCIGGLGLARGYLGEPRRTAERFQPDPFAPAPGSRLYWTGDVARLRHGGDIELRGRQDRQIKLRGFRVELEEVESVLARHPRVREVAVVLWAKGRDDERLVAYVVARDEAAHDRDALSHRALADWVKSSLPAYMVPADFIQLDAIPLDPRGKVNRRALPSPTEDRRLRADYVAPGTATEEHIAALWSEVLGGRRVGARDDFFELGGNSLLATQVTARMARAMEVEVPLRTFFSMPTVAQLARYIDTIAQARADAHASPEDPDEDREEIEL